MVEVFEAKDDDSAWRDVVVSDWLDLPEGEEIHLARLVRSCAGPVDRLSATPRMPAKDRQLFTRAGLLMLDAWEQQDDEPDCTCCICQMKEVIDQIGARLAEDERNDL